MSNTEPANGTACASPGCQEDCVVYLAESDLFLCPEHRAEAEVA